MGASVRASQHLGARRRRGRRHAPMSEINVTPFVDVMLVLLIIFMVAAPLLTVGVPIELPQAKGSQLETNKEPLTITIAPGGVEVTASVGEVFIGETKIALADLAEKLKAIAKNGVEDQIFVRGDRRVMNETVLKVMGRIRAAGFRKVSFVAEDEPGG